MSQSELPAATPEDRWVADGWAVHGTWFYSPDEHAFYRLDADGTGESRQEFTLVQGTTVRIVGSEGTEVGLSNGEDPYPVSTIRELAGELQGGYLHGIPPGAHRVLDGTTVVDAGEYLLVSPPTTSPGDRLPRLSPAPLSPRHTDLSAATTERLAQPVDESLSSPTYVISIRDTHSGLPKLLDALGTDSLARSANQGAANGDSTRMQTAGDGGTLNADAFAPGDSAVESVAVYDTEKPHTVARFIDTSPHPSATFEEPNLRRFAQHWIADCPRVLNACAGPTHLRHPSGGEIVRNDRNPDVDADYHVDVAELAAHLDESSFDAVIFDPPWTLYQASLRYQGYAVGRDLSNDSLPQNNIEIDVRELPFDVPGEAAAMQAGGPGQQGTLQQFGPEQSTAVSASSASETEAKSQLGHARLAKLGFDYLLRENGRVIQFSYNGTIMPADLGYQRLCRYAFDPVGEGKTLIAGVDQRE